MSKPVRAKRLCYSNLTSPLLDNILNPSDREYLPLEINEQERFFLSSNTLEVLVPKR
jgi:hypothetical protein